MKNQPKNFTRKCPECQEEIFYHSKTTRENSETQNVMCRKCQIERQNFKTSQLPRQDWPRKCPQCEKTIIHTLKSNRDRSEKNQKVCVPCARKNTDQRGKKNHFFGKTHTLEMREKMSKVRMGIPATEERKKNMAEYARTHDNPMKGRSVYSVWLEKYGKEIADENMKKLKEKHSQNNSGEKNWNFGKPATQGSGNGWSCWYKNFFFRSLRELSFVLDYLERFNLNWISAELQKYKIKYVDFEGKERNYFPDFLIEGKYLIEIKPKNLHSSQKIVAKKEAAIKFCQENNLIYKLIDVQISDKIKNLYLTGKIIPMERYKEKFKNFFKM